MKKVIIKKSIFTALLCFSLIMTISAVIGGIFESVFSIFVSQDLTFIDGETGFTIISREVVRYYLDLETTVRNAAKSDQDLIIENTLSPDNITDVVLVYVTYLAGHDNSKGNPCDMNNYSNLEALKKVFDFMNGYEMKTEIKQRNDGDIIGSYSITVNTEERQVYEDEIENSYGQCLIADTGVDKIPVRSLIAIDGSIYRVTGTFPSQDNLSISIKIPAGAEDPFQGAVRQVQFKTSAEVAQISYTVTSIKYIQHDIEWYENTIKFDEEQQEYMDELKPEYNELKKETEVLLSELKYVEADIASSDFGSIPGSIDVSNVKPLKPNLSQEEFIATIGDAAVSYYAAYQILPSLTIAQAINESGWGKTGLAGYNNFFGMKWREGCGCAYVEYSSNESPEEGTTVMIVSKFRAYPSVAAGIKGYYDFISTPRYANLKGELDPMKACSLIKQDGWATSNTYAQKLQRLIVQFNLTEYDQKAGVIH